MKTLDFLTREMTLGQAALKWLLAEPRVVTTLPNIYDDEQLAEFAAASDQPRPRRASSSRASPSSTTTNFGVDEEPMSVQGHDDARARREPGSAGRAQPHRPSALHARRRESLMLNLWHDLPAGRTRPRTSPR